MRDQKFETGEELDNRLAKARERRAERRKELQRLNLKFETTEQRENRLAKERQRMYLSRANLPPEKREKALQRRRELYAKRATKKYPVKTPCNEEANIEMEIMQNNCNKELIVAFDEEKQNIKIKKDCRLRGKKHRLEEIIKNRGYKRGLEIQKIVGACIDIIEGGELMFLVKWNLCDELDLIPASEVNSKNPEIVINFYEAQSSIVKAASLRESYSKPLIIKERKVRTKQEITECDEDFSSNLISYESETSISSFIPEIKETQGDDISEYQTKLLSDEHMDLSNSNMYNSGNAEDF